MNKKINTILAGLIISSLLIGCANTADDVVSNTPAASQTVQADYSHAEDTDPDYAIVLPDDQVNEITLTLSPENWQAVLADMTEKYGEFGSSQGMGAGPGGRGGQVPQRGQPDAQAQGANPEMDAPQWDATAPAEMPNFENQRGEQAAPQPNEGQNRLPEGGPGGGRGQGMGGMMMDGDDDENPIWVDASITFNDEIWDHVGFRLKGNSSLRSSWGSGNYKLPFKLDFDQFEDDYPETENQRFYGFKQLTFSSNFSDSSYLRETLAADIFRAAGVPAAQTAFYAVYVDYGEGPLYFGLYTAVEVVDDTLIQTQFEDDSGNVYKPSGSAATFAAGTYNESQYDKQTNEEESDYSDVKALMEVLNSDVRLTDASEWRAQLEAVFDVDVFLRWLAANSIMSNWDTYGSMGHNFYLYNDPDSGQLVWIPWDNNQSIGGRGNGAGGRSPMGQTSSSIGNENTGENWPLIAYLLADENYQQEYFQAVEEVLAEAFNPDNLEAEINRLHKLIAPYVEAEIENHTTLSDTSAFETSVQTLIETIETRYQAARDYLAQYQ